MRKVFRTPIHKKSEAIWGENRRKQRTKHVNRFGWCWWWSRLTWETEEQQEEAGGGENDDFEMFTAGIISHLWNSFEKARTWYTPHDSEVCWGLMCAIWKKILMTFSEGWWNHEKESKSTISPTESIFCRLTMMIVRLPLCFHHSCCCDSEHSFLSKFRFDPAYIRKDWCPAKLIWFSLSLSPDQNSSWKVTLMILNLNRDSLRNPFLRFLKEFQWNCQIRKNFNLMTRMTLMILFQVKSQGRLRQIDYQTWSGMMITLFFQDFLNSWWGLGGTTIRTLLGEERKSHLILGSKVIIFITAPLIMMEELFWFLGMPPALLIPLYPNSF